MAQLFIIYNNISRPVHDPPLPSVTPNDPNPKSGGRDPNPRIDAYAPDLGEPPSLYLIMSLLNWAPRWRDHALLAPTYRNYVSSGPLPSGIQLFHFIDVDVYGYMSTYM